MNSRNLNELLDDIMICALLMSERDSYKEFVDCIPEALHSIYELSLILGVKVRYSTINTILGYVRGFDELGEFDVDRMIALLRQLASNNAENLSKVLLRRVLEIAVGKEINITTHSRDALELLLSTFYAMFLLTLYNFEKDTQIQDIPIISIPQTSAETITV
ncbi:MAG: hypothetical protein N3E36_06985 [Sulfolobales archaeon]|nr:hypothetical protein [Ignisphaera sp.]MCX8199738.1 hypothetical protein [Sulfolobales archaeon]MDW8086106.1 hypothetical protein [Ignisphaera sp.]